jgi:hypothetical protein
VKKFACFRRTVPERFGLMSSLFLITTVLKNHVILAVILRKCDRLKTEVFKQ